jgi:NAD(P)-dependent dehydrogenase (short-subunit alcohol dehydrogenase family)
VLPHFIKQKDGVIINVSSTLGLRGIPRSTVYSASKAALQNFTQTLALEVAPQNVRVNAVCFGLIQTPIHGSTPLSGSAQPLGRVGTPEEAAYSIFHLSTPEAGFTTGAVLVVDGGINL